MKIKVGAGVKLGFHGKHIDRMDIIHGITTNELVQESIDFSSTAPVDLTDCALVAFIDNASFFVFPDYLIPETPIETEWLSLIK